VALSKIRGEFARTDVIRAMHALGYLPGRHAATGCGRRQLMTERIELIARRQPDLHGGHPDYFVFAGEQLVGRIYQTHFTSTSEGWFWGVNGLTVDSTVGAVMHGYALSFRDARAKLRTAFDRWLEWAMAMPAEDLKHCAIAAGLRAMDAGEAVN
jgi:hypothetical protein